MKHFLWAVFLIPGVMEAQSIEAPLERRIENTIRQYNKEQLPGYFIPAFGVFVRPNTMTLFGDPIIESFSFVDIIIEAKFFRYNPAFGYFRLNLGITDLPRPINDSNALTRYGSLPFRAGLSVGGGGHVLDSRSKETGRGHALSVMGGILWDFVALDVPSGIYNGLGIEMEIRYQYNINAFSAFAMGFNLAYKGIFFSNAGGTTVLDTTSGINYGVSLGFSF